MRSRIIFFLILGTIAAVDIVSCRRAGMWLVKDDNPDHGDAMVLLMGSIPDRVMKAADLYNSGTSTRLIIVEESMGNYRELEERGVNIISNTTQAYNAAVGLRVPADSIIVLPGDARSTLNEATVIRNYLAGDNKTDTIILVTSPAHTRRSALIFNTVFRKAHLPVTVLCCPADNNRYNLKKWWRDKEGIQAVLGEYVKIVAFVSVERWEEETEGRRDGGTESRNKEGARERESAPSTNLREVASILGM